MHKHLKINFIYKPDHKIYFQELRKRLESIGFEVSALEIEEVPDSLDSTQFYILSEEFKDLHDLGHFGFIRNAQIVISDNGQDYSNLDLTYVVQKFYEITKMKGDFIELTSQIEREVERLQAWYQQQIPIREEKNDGLYLCSKHKSGNKPGGDFFETIDTGASLQIILTNTNSYILNARILELIMIYKHEEDQSINELLKSFVETQQHFNDSELNLTILEISKRDLSFSGFHFGKNDIYDPSNQLKILSNTFNVSEDYLDAASFSGKLSLGQRIILSSKGVLANWCKKLAHKDYYQHLSSALDPKKDLEKIILKLYEENSLEYDTSIIWTEVNSHGIHEA